MATPAEAELPIPPQFFGCSDFILSWSQIDFWSGTNCFIKGRSSGD